MKYSNEHRGKNFSIEINNPHIEGGMVSKHPFYEGVMLDWINDNIPHGGEYIDIGGYVGNHAIYFALFCTSDLVYSFEPVYYHQLRKNVEENDICNVIYLPYGLSDEHCVMGSVDRSNGGNSAATSLVDGEGVSVRMLDDFIETFSNVRLIKIDVEGMEEKVLAGGMNTIRKFRPHIFVEINTEDRLKRIDEGLGSLGYTRVRRFNSTPTYYYQP